MNNGQVPINMEAEVLRLPRLIGKVPPPLRMKNTTLEGSSSGYDPVMVSLGPYHHGRPELQNAQEFKQISLKQFLDDGLKRLDRESLRRSILSEIEQVKESYAEISVNNDALAEMMLLDACFIIRCMEIRTTKPKVDQDLWSVWRYHLGDAGCHRYADRDIMVLENQIPFFLLKLVMSQKYSKEDGEDLVAKFLGWTLFMKVGTTLETPRENEDPPLHILAAFRRVLVEKTSITHPQTHQLTYSMINDDHFYTCGSVTDLKAKGIYFGQSSSHSFQDIKFDSCVYYAQLQLPVRYISDGTLVILANMIAYELCPRSNSTDMAVCSYVNLMKSLIQTPADVKVLEEAGVFALNRFQNKKQVVEMFKRLDTLDLDNKEIYEDVMFRVGKHCKNKVKTWTADDLIQTRLHSPCTFIALVAGVTFFILTCVSVYYSIHPVHQK